MSYRAYILDTDGLAECCIEEGMRHLAMKQASEYYWCFNRSLSEKSAPNYPTSYQCSTCGRTHEFKVKEIE